MKNSSKRYDINRLRPRHGHKYTEYKMCPTIMIVICFKQHLSNIWSSIHENVALLIKKGVAVKPTIDHNSAVSKALLGKF